MSLFPSETMLKLMFCAEAELDPAAFAAGGLHPWPLIRMSLSTSLVDNDIDRTRRAAENPAWGAVAARIDALYEQHRAAAVLAGDRSRDVFDAWPLGPQPQGMLDFLFFTRSDEHFITTPHGWSAPILDALFEVAQEHHRAAKLEVLTPLSTQRMPRLYPTLLTASSVAKGSRAGEAGELAGLRDCAEKLTLRLQTWLRERVGLALSVWPGIEKMLTASFAYRLLFQRILDQLPPRNVVLNCFYHPAAYGLMWAARERGSRTIEVQHGLNGYFHYGYTHWTRQPPGGYFLWPQLFLTWDTASANNICRWFRPEDTAHGALVAGRLPVAAVSRQFAAEAAALRQRARSHAKTVLISLQTTPGTTIDHVFPEVIKAAPADWLWLVRGHPMADPQNAAVCKRDYIEDRLRAIGRDNWELDLSTRLPLDVVLPLADHHLTHFSSVALEALAFGVPTTFVNRTAAENFHKDLVEQKLAYCETQAGSIIDSIVKGQSGLLWQKDAGNIMTDREVARRALARLAE